MSKIVIHRDLSTQQLFTEAIMELRDRGFVPSLRSGPTGIGKTLEEHLGIEENCIDMPDIGTVELKAERIISNSMLTLKTKSPEIRGSNNRLVNEYGYKTPDSIQLNPNLNILHSTVTMGDFNTLNGVPFLKITPVGKRLYMEHAHDGIIDYLYWEDKSLAKAIKKKYPYKKLYYVLAKSKFIDDREYFHYVKAYYLEGFDSQKLMECLKTGDIKIDLRIGIYTSGAKKGKRHDHGTGIRAVIQNLDMCFDKRVELL